MYTYTHHRKVAYHETDKMGITHHSNYIKFMEEARVGYLESIDLPFQALEARGVTSPVIGIQIDYQHPSTFADELCIKVSVVNYTGVRFEVVYEVVKAEDGTKVAAATSKHCFLAGEKVVSLKKVCPDLHEKFAARIG